MAVIDRAASSSDSKTREYVDRYFREQVGMTVWPAALPAATGSASMRAVLYVVGKPVHGRGDVTAVAQP